MDITHLKICTREIEAHVHMKIYISNIIDAFSKNKHRNKQIIDTIKVNKVFKGCN